MIISKIFYFYFYLELTIREIASELQLNESTVKNYLYRTIKEIKFENLRKEKVAFDLKMNVDDRGSFTELLRTEKCGQFSVNVSKAGITKGQHWHHSKWEFFIVVSGKGLIQQRKIDARGQAPR